MWDLVTGAQRYQFSSPADQPTCVAYAPSCPRSAAAGEELQEAVAGGEGEGVYFSGERHLVAGYASGAIRVFDVPSTCTMFELEQHQGAVHQVTLV